MTRRRNSCFLRRISVLFWYILISRRAVNGLYVCDFLTRAVAGASLETCCWHGNLPSVDWRGVCLVRAIANCLCYQRWMADKMSGWVRTAVLYPSWPRRSRRRLASTLSRPERRTRAHADWLPNEFDLKLSVAKCELACLKIAHGRLGRLSNNSLFTYDYLV